MYQVVYISTARREYSKRELADILEVSRRNNTRDEITGVLCYHGGTFFQMLEGDEEKVRAVMARVDRDPRHYGVTILLEQDVNRRAMPEWSMAFREITDDEAEKLDGFSSLLKHPEQSLDALNDASSDALLMLQGFCDTSRAATRL